MTGQTPHERLIGKSILHYSSVTSTNDTARELASKQADEGTVVVAAEQTLGRGSRGRKWISPPGVNLLFSVILRPGIAHNRMSDLAFVASVALARCLTDRFHLKAQIKWPNDVRVSGRKIAGVLIETAGNDPIFAVIGVGLNVNWTDMPAEMAETATSIALETDRNADMDEVLGWVVDSMDETYQLYRAEDFESVLTRWKRLDCTIGTAVKIAVGEGTIEGCAEDIDSDGSLVVRLSDGVVQHVPAVGLIVE
jgi:BirA family transcriptional regulator, biotin operon repressor / biotin---[acetyl-CoA-carboxylase] ligase